MTGLFSYPKRKLRKLIKKGEFEEAIALANSMEEKYQYDPDFLFIMAGMFYILEDAKKTLHYVDRVLEINEYDTEALSLKLRAHQYFKENAKVIDCCKRILKIDADAYQVRDILNELEGK
uniref:TPR repeat-containing protein n=1 Tax=uncultured marine thaumarchaeote KM3_149_F07 TaxID=1456013 RepID=A0A075GD11_9ARCH|nr:TPR repeat-containing protein [uncultured marine thaumarchaeote KM3_149_F07]